MRTTMSLLDDKTRTLWGQFSPRIHEIQHRMNEDRISLQVYPPVYFQHFQPGTEFDKWAAVEVNDVESIPSNMHGFELMGGYYAVFHRSGPSSDHSIFRWIFTEWLPRSGHTLDHRPHFEVLGPNYRVNDSHSEEEIWIPIMAE